jgi:hypothetical protein
MARGRNGIWTTGGGEAYLTVSELRTPEEEITTVMNVAAHLPLRWQAIRAHASQVSPYDDLPDDLARVFLATARLRLVAGDDQFSSGAFTTAHTRADS